MGLGNWIAKKGRTATGKRVGSISVLIAEIKNISQEFSQLENSLKAINTLTIDEVKGLTSSVSWVNVPFVGGVKNMFNNTFNKRQGEVTQLYHASKNPETYKLITSIHTFIDSTLLVWLEKVSTVTDEKQLVVYFGNGKGAHGTFMKTLSDLSLNIDQINKLVGATIKSDNILVNVSTKLSKIYDVIGLIVISLRDSKFSNKVVLTKYAEYLMSYISGVLAADNDFDGQITSVNSIFVLNDYIVNTYFKTLVASDMNDKYINALYVLVGSLKKKIYTKDTHVEKFIKKNNLSFGDNAQNPEDNVVIKSIIADVNSQTFGNPNLKQIYLDFLLKKYLVSKNLDDTLATKLKILNNSIVRNIITISVQSPQIDSYTLAIDKIFLNLDTNVINNDADAENYVNNILNSTIPSGKQL